MTERKTFFSIAAIVSSAMFMAVSYYVTTPHWQSFAERTLGRLYILGAVAVVFLYLFGFLGFTAVGLGLGILGVVRRESPAWLRRAGLALGLLTPAGIAMVFSRLA